MAYKMSQQQQQQQQRELECMLPSVADPCCAVLWQGRSRGSGAQKPQEIYSNNISLLLSHPFPQGPALPAQQKACATARPSSTCSCRCLLLLLVPFHCRPPCRHRTRGRRSYPLGSDPLCRRHRRQSRGWPAAAACASSRRCRCRGPHRRCLGRRARCRLPPPRSGTAGWPPAPRLQRQRRSGKRLGSWVPRSA